MFRQLLQGLSATLLFVSSGSKAAEFEVLHEGEIGASIFVSGTIRQGDLKDFVATSKKLRSSHQHYWIDSPGGDVDVALSIATVLYRLGASVTIPDDAECSSACLLLFAGAADRRAGDGAIFGFHRPRTVMNRGSSPPTRSNVESMIADYRGFLRRRGFSGAILDAATRTKPDDVLTIVGQDIFSYIPEIDPYLLELRTWYAAQTYGLPTEEYRSRRSKGEQVGRRFCSTLDRGAYGDGIEGALKYQIALEECVQPWRESVLWGMSVDRHEARVSDLSTCAPSAEEISAYDDEQRVIYEDVLEGYGPDDYAWKFDNSLRTQVNRCRVEIMSTD